MEMQDLGTKLRMVVMAHRRINLMKKHDEPELTHSGGQDHQDPAPRTQDDPVSVAQNFYSPLLL
jgi:hypothetical protein